MKVIPLEKIVPLSEDGFELEVTPDVIGCPLLYHRMVPGELELLLSVSHLNDTSVPAVMGKVGFGVISSLVIDPAN